MTDINIQYGQYVVTEAQQCVNLGVGQPSNMKLPLKEFQDALINVTQRTDPAILQYGKITGYNEFTKDFSNYLSQLYDLNVNENELLPTSGVTGALSLILSTCKQNSNQNIIVICENPTYFLALNIFKEFGFKVIPVPLLKDGVDLDAVRNIAYFNTSCECFFYTIPIHQNPSGCTMSHEQRLKLAKILDVCKNLTVLADEVYYNLTFNTDNTLPKPMKYYHERCISIGSFSKTLFPAIRLGWIHANKSIIDNLSLCGQLDSSGCVNPIGCSVVHELIRSGELLKITNMWKSFLSNNCDVLYKAVTEQLSEYIKSVTKPKGGYFLWIEFNDEIDVEHLSLSMEKFGIKFHHGNKFSSDKSAKNFMRLSFSWYTGPNEYILGVTRLKELIETTYKRVIPSVFVLGHTGKLGSLIVDEINNSQDVKFGGNIGRNINLDDITSNSVIIDVSRPDGTKKLLEKLLEGNTYCPVIIGTTGDLPMNLITEYGKLAPIMVCANFSEGINEFINIISHLEKTNWNVQMVEKHHIHKVDKPSGTAKMLANTYGTEYIKIEDIQCVREGEIIGQHDLILDNGTETITISHNVKSRNVFARGAIELVKKMSKKIPQKKSI